MNFSVPSIAEASHLIAQRKLSPVELVEDCLQRIDVMDEELHSFVRILADDAHAAARKAESEIWSGLYRGPLHGIPIGLKDIFDLAGVPTTAHSRLYEDNISREDSAVAARLKEAGAIILGKLATYEFALGGPSFDLPWPPARNPWDQSRITGGSSSGTGVAVSAGLVLAGIGSDTGGSIRFPAAYCGVAGIKPTYGLVSRRGAVPLAYSLDTVGPMAWTVEDCAIMLQSMAGHDPNDPASVGVSIPDYREALRMDLRGVKIGIVRHFFEEDNVISPMAIEAIDEAISILKSLGADVRVVTLSPLEDYSSVALSIMLIEGFSVHQRNLSERPEMYGAYFRDRMALGAFFTGADYVQALRRRSELSAELSETFRSFDVLVTAITSGEAPPVDTVSPFASYEKPILSAPFNAAGCPAMSVCCGFSPSGLPLAFQIAGKPFDEAKVFQVGHAYEKATEWRKNRPNQAIRANI